MRRKAWWKRFILGSDLITCIQSSIQCPQLGSADALCLFFLSSFIISFQSVPSAFCDGAEIKHWAARASKVFYHHRDTVQFCIEAEDKTLNNLNLQMCRRINSQSLDRTSGLLLQLLDGNYIYYINIPDLFDFHNMFIRVSSVNNKIILFVYNPKQLAVTMAMHHGGSDLRQCIVVAFPWVEGTSLLLLPSCWLMSPSLDLILMTACFKAIVTHSNLKTYISCSPAESVWCKFRRFIQLSLVKGQRWITITEWGCGNIFHN